MKIVFQKRALLDHLMPAMGTVSARNTITTIEGVLIETLGGNTVRLSTYDMAKGIRSTFEALEVVEEGKCIVSAQRFLQIVKLLGGDEITLSIDDSLSGTVSSDNSSFSVFALRGEDFPTLPELSGRRGFEIDSQLLKSKIAKVMHSVSDQDSRPMLCGVFFEIKGDTMKVVSCDGYSLSICTVRCDIRDIGEEQTDTYSFILPGSSLGELSKLLDVDTTVRVFLARKHAIIKIDDFVFFTRMIDGQYLDYEKIIPKGQTVFVTVNRERMLEGLERANLIADEKIQGSSRSYVKMTVDGGCVELTSTSVNGKVRDIFACKHEGDKIQIGFNCRYLINNIRAAEGEEIVLSLKSANQSMTIEPLCKDGEDSFFYMLLPVRMNDQA